MYRDQRYKLVVYHGMGLGELYDLHEDPWEFDNLWDDTAHQSTKADLVFASFDSHVLLTTDVGSRRIAPM
jgi:superfamily I DNA and RNA helicase